MPQKKSWDDLPSRCKADAIVPAYIILHPTSNITCTITIYQTSPFSGYFHSVGGCRGFVGTVILIAGRSPNSQNTKWERQLANITPPANITWDIAMDKIERAALTIYHDILPEEILGPSVRGWIWDDSITYAPNITLVNVSVVPDSEMRPESLDPNYALTTRESENCGKGFIWKDGNLLREGRNYTERHYYALKCFNSSPYKKFWIVGTSESRMIFQQMCIALGKTINTRLGNGTRVQNEAIPPIDKRTMYANCGNINFVNMCQFGCGCKFLPHLNEIEPDLSGHWISASCGLHDEYLDGADEFISSFRELETWGRLMKPNNSHIQYRIVNAVNPHKTRPGKFKIARNNLKYSMLRNVACDILGSSPYLSVIDLFKITEPIYDLSRDAVHYYDWVYRELALSVMESLCIRP